MIRTYVVVYSLIGKPGKTFSTRCVTSLAYNTNFESLRKMIAVRHDVDAEDIEIESTTLMSTVSTDDNVTALR